MTTLYANPYDTSYTGFYFTSTEEFVSHMDKAPYEEVEIDYIDGLNPKLFATTGIYQSNIGIWFSDLDQIEDNSTPGISIIYLLDYLSLDDALARYEEVMIWYGTSEDYASEIFSDFIELDNLPDIIKYHIDYSGIAHDMELNSEITQVGYNTWVTNCMQF
jgi:hypothetical protein